MLTLLTLAAAAAMPGIMPEASRADIVWAAEGGFCEPETVLPLPDGKLLVSNVCGFREKGNGYLSLLDGDGHVVDWRVVEGLDAPLGMALYKNWIYVVDSNRLALIRWPEFEFRGYSPIDTAIANDIAIAPEGPAYVTDTAAGKVLEITIDNLQRALTVEGRFPGANGIAINGDNLYVGGERLWKVHLPTNEVTTIGPFWLAHMAANEIEPDGTLQITPVSGPLIRYRGDDDIEILGGDGVSSANHGYAPDFGLALIPTGFDNRVIAIRVPPPRHTAPD